MNWIFSPNNNCLHVSYDFLDEQINTELSCCFLTIDYRCYASSIQDFDDFYFGIAL